MKYKVCPDCGANLDFGEECDCKKNESDTSATVSPSKGKDAVDSLPENRATVKDCEMLDAWIKETGAQKADIAVELKNRFPLISRQILTQASHWERYGVILHPIAMDLLADIYGLNLADRPKHSQKRKPKKALTYRCTARMYDRILAAKDELGIATDQEFIAVAIESYLEGKEK